MTFQKAHHNIDGKSQRSSNDERRKQTQQFDRSAPERFNIDSCNDHHNGKYNQKFEAAHCFFVQFQSFPPLTRSFPLKNRLIPAIYSSGQKAENFLLKVR